MKVEKQEANQDLNFIKINSLTKTSYDLNQNYTAL